MTPNPEGEGDTFLLNVGKKLADNMMKKLTRLGFAITQCKPQIGFLFSCLHRASMITLGQQISKNIFVSVMNMLLICLFASMKLEKGHKKINWL